jgi:hypothetical protein
MVFVVVLLSTLSMYAYVGPPEDAGGVWKYLPTPGDSRFAGCNRFLNTTEVGKWPGTFVGDSTEVGKIVFHCSGSMSLNAIVSFVDVKVGGKSGGLEMSAVGTRPAGDSEWYGYWVILSGTGELATLRGQGTWWGPGYNPAEPHVWGHIEYAGKVHFKPEK